MTNKIKNFKIFQWKTTSICECNNVERYIKTHVTHFLIKCKLIFHLKRAGMSKLPSKMCQLISNHYLKGIKKILKTLHKISKKSRWGGGPPNPTRSRQLLDRLRVNTEEQMRLHVICVLVLWLDPRNEFRRHARFCTRPRHWLPNSKSSFSIALVALPSWYNGLNSFNYFTRY